MTVSPLVLTCLCTKGHETAVCVSHSPGTSFPGFTGQGNPNSLPSNVIPKEKEGTPENVSLLMREALASSHPPLPLLPQ